MCNLSIILFRPGPATDIISGAKEVKGRTHTYYQVLIDARDIPHIVSAVNIEVTYNLPS